MLKVLDIGCLAHIFSVVWTVGNSTCGVEGGAMQMMAGPLNSGPALDLHGVSGRVQIQTA